MILQELKRSIPYMLRFFIIFFIHIYHKNSCKTVSLLSSHRTLLCLQTHQVKQHQEKPILNNYQEPYRIHGVGALDILDTGRTFRNNNEPNNLRTGTPAACTEFSFEIDRSTNICKDIP